VFKPLWIVWRKEMIDALRDKRSMRMAFLPVFYFVGIFVATFFFVLNMQQDNRVGGTTQIPMVMQGGEYLPELRDWLEEQGAVIETREDDVYLAVRRGDAELALIIPADVIEQKTRGKALTLWLVYDATNRNVHSKLGFVRDQINTWNSRTGSVNLLARGIAPEVGSGLLLRESNVADDQKMSVMLLGSLPMIIVLSAFIASMGFSADMTAGERERRSLESLLITPTSSSNIMLGKWLTSFCLSLAVTFLTLLFLWIALVYLPFSELGVRVLVSSFTMLAILFSLLPMIMLGVSLQLAIAIFARSFKDAQTYIGLFMFIPMVPGLFVMFNPGVTTDWFTWVPVLGQLVVIRDLLVGEAISAQALLRFWLTGLVVTYLTLLFAAAQLRRSRIVYG